MIVVRRLAVALACLATSAVALAPAAVAAPVKPAMGERIVLTCPSGQVAIVTAPGNGDFTAGFIVGTHQVLVPYHFTFTVTGANGQVIESETATKGRAPIPSDAIVCTFRETFTEGGQTFTFTGTVTAVVRGKP